MQKTPANFKILRKCFFCIDFYFQNQAVSMVSETRFFQVLAVERFQMLGFIDPVQVRKTSTLVEYDSHVRHSTIFKLLFWFIASYYPICQFVFRFFLQCHTWLYERKLPRNKNSDQGRNCVCRKLTINRLLFQLESLESCHPFSTNSISEEKKQHEFQSICRFDCLRFGCVCCIASGRATRRGYRWVYIIIGQPNFFILMV